MRNTLLRIRSFLTHWLNVVNEHSVHSPFFYDFYKEVINKPNVGAFPDLNNLRASLLGNKTQITIDDLGAGSVKDNSKRKTLSEIASVSIASHKQASFYYRILNYIDASLVVELGTSLGMTSLYLAKKANTEVFTFEGSHALAQVALTHFELLEATNIKLTEGNIDHTLRNFLQNPRKIQFALIDANHRFEPTVRYFEALAKRMADKGIMVIDDINWSEEMQQAWQHLRLHQLVYGSVDLFHCGLLFFDPSLNRQHFTWTLK